MPTVYVTAPRDAAADIARELVDRRLAACVNTVDCESVYRWEGEVLDDPETILLAKTTDEGSEALTAAIEELHPYDVPCIETFDETAVLDAFAAWRAESVGDPES